MHRDPPLDKQFGKAEQHVIGTEPTCHLNRQALPRGHMTIVSTFTGCPPAVLVAIKS